MFGCRLGLGGLILALCACGGRASDDDEEDEPTGGSPATAGAGQGGTRVASGGARFAAGGAFGQAAGGQGSGGRPFVDPGCPDVVPPPAQVECDVSGQTGCPERFGCYPFVDHPFGEGCGAQTFGARCIPAGSGLQGEGCGAGTAGCAPGFICVVGGHAGRRCAKLCTFQGPGECPAGLLCGDTDVRGYGVCG